MEKLLSDLLTYSRTIHPDTATVDKTDLSKSLAQALTTLNNRIEENGATIVFDELPTVAADEAQLAQVFQNLLSNALKYRLRDHSPNIVISAEQRGNSGLCPLQTTGSALTSSMPVAFLGFLSAWTKTSIRVPARIGNLPSHN